METSKNPTSTKPATAAYENTMKAIVHDEYGSPDVLALQQIKKPVVNDDEVLVRVHAASANPLDGHFLTGKPYMMRIAGVGLRRPKRNIPGVDMAGVVETVGQNVTQFQQGDEVFGRGAGSFAEYVVVPEQTIVSKPANVSFEQAAAVRLGALTALQGLRDKGKVESGHRVLINGASGGVGTFAVQIAKSYGAEVTGVCSTRNVDMVRSIGADHVIDYTEEDFTQTGQQYDVVFDNMGNHPPSAYKRALTPEGTYVIVGGPKKNRLLGPVPYSIKALLVFMFSSQKATILSTRDNKEDLIVLQDLLASGEIMPVIDRAYPLSKAPQAIRYLQEGHAQGKIVITV